MKTAVLIIGSIILLGMLDAAGIIHIAALHSLVSFIGNVLAG